MYNHEIGFNFVKIAILRSMLVVVIYSIKMIHIWIWNDVLYSGTTYMQ